MIKLQEYNGFIIFLVIIKHFYVNWHKHKPFSGSLLNILKDKQAPTVLLL